MLRLAFPQIPFSRFISDSEAPNLRMVSSLSTFFLCTHSLKSPTLKPLTKFYCFARLRFRVPPKASSRNKNANTDSVETPSLQPSSLKPPYDSSSSLLRCFRFDELGMEIVLIALPAALALAADPIASLIDTAFVGHIGAVELAAVGVSASGFNLVSKAFNVPLLNVTASFVAEEQALIRKEEESIPSDKNGMFFNYGIKKLLPSVSTSLALAATLGMAETVVLTLGSGILMNIMGIPADSPMRGPAEQFLTLRAFGTPAIVLALAAQGTFRGFLDTKTPLYAVGVGNFLKAILDPILIFLFGLGGATVATLISEYLIAFILLWKLSDKVLLIPSEFYGRKFFSYLKSGGLVSARTLAVFITVMLSTSVAAQQGPIPPMAGHQICMQVWLSVSLLNDALTFLLQALLACNYSLGNYEQASLVIFRVMQIGLGAGITLSMILFFGFGAFSSLFSTDSEVLDVARSGIWFVAGSQPVNALAFVIDGIYYGVSDFGYAAYSMVEQQKWALGYILV
ncbi:protein DETOXIFICATION 44, chloroplastic [Glycine max]|uniref:protein DETOXIFICATION 44, chloroplastic n=1 Tax=Glycine max TaxID=3847 RepID=UPI001B357F46|nr:protein DETOXIFICATION 44, chloroplastic [Glycine max]